MVGFLLIYAVLCTDGICKVSRNFLWICTLLLGVIIGFRGITVGVDTKTYAMMFNDISVYGYAGYPEPLFGLTMSLFSKMGMSYICFQVFIAAITMLLISKVSLKESRKPMMSIFLFYGLYFGFYAMNICRQILAVSLILFGYMLLTQSKPKKFLFCILLATSIHYISILSLGALWIKRIKVKNKTKLYIVLVLSLILGLFLSDALILKLLSPILGNYTSYLLGTDSNGFRENSRLVLALLLCFFWTALLIITIISGKKRILNSIWFKTYLLGVITSNLTMRMELGLRVTLLFSISQIIFFPLFIRENRLTSKYYGYFIIISFTTIFFLIFLANNSAGILPYHLYF